jgi:acylphosphatase
MTKAIAHLVYYKGRVQGVGFRATAAWIASQFAVTGWVRNLSDGRVQLFTEGPPDQVESFLRVIRNRLKQYVEEEQIEEQAPSGDNVGFKIVH